MTKYTPDLDADRLRQLSEEVRRISRSLAQLSVGAGQHQAGASAEPQANVPEVSERTVQWIIDARKLRSRFLPAQLFADPAWDILLELLRAEIAQQRIAVSSLCIAANAPATTALRYIKTMFHQGLIMREADPFDGRRVYVTLALDVSNALRNYCASVFERPVGGDAPARPRRR